MPRHSQSVRSATHAGTWYTDHVAALSEQLTSWLERATIDKEIYPSRIIIAPHAGYDYSGKTAAYSYAQLEPSNIDRVILLGPSHHRYLEGCALSKFDAYETPFGNITLDRQGIEKLNNTGAFSSMSESTDEKEHSLEMHLPYLFHIMKKKEFSLIPVLVGHLDKPETAASVYGPIFAELYKDQRTVFVISSDFCHWGNRFQFTRHSSASSSESISSFIKTLDLEGVEHICNLNYKGFKKYLNQSQNTICGQNPILLILKMLQCLQAEKWDLVPMKLLDYSQSSQVVSLSDSSVSYAAIGMK